MDKGIVYVCDECGSDDVRGEALVAWDVEAQEWQVSTYSGHAQCVDCGDEAYLVERPLYLKDYAKLAIEKEEAHGVSQ